MLQIITTSYIKTKKLLLYRTSASRRSGCHRPSHTNGHGYMDGLTFHKDYEYLFSILTNSNSQHTIFTVITIIYDSVFRIIENY